MPKQRVIKPLVDITAYLDNLNIGGAAGIAGHAGPVFDGHRLAPSPFPNRASASDMGPPTMCRNEQARPS